MHIGSCMTGLWATDGSVSAVDTQGVMFMGTWLGLVTGGVRYLVGFDMLTS